MTELTNKEINLKIVEYVDGVAVDDDEIFSAHNPDSQQVLVWDESLRNGGGDNTTVDYISDDAFCFRAMRDNGFDTLFQPETKLWVCYPMPKNSVSGGKDKSLNKAILLTYLKMKEGE